jgi:DNA-binding HxlR family transcriptional regulator
VNTTASEIEAQARTERGTKIRDPDENLRRKLPADAWDNKLVPLLELFDVLGRRWTLRVLWELRDEPATFRELRSRCGGMSSSVLTSRLGDLRTHGLVDHNTGEGYELTSAGRGVARRIADLYVWLVSKQSPDQRRRAR